MFFFQNLSLFIKTLLSFWKFCTRKQGKILSYEQVSHSTKWSEQSALLLNSLTLCRLELQPEQEHSIVPLCELPAFQRSKYKLQLLSNWKIVSQWYPLLTEKRVAGQDNKASKYIFPGRLEGSFPLNIMKSVLAKSFSFRLPYRNRRKTLRPILNSYIK